MRNRTDISLCILHRNSLHEVPLLKITVLMKAIIKIIYNKLIN